MNPIAPLQRRWLWLSIILMASTGHAQTSTQAWIQWTGQQQWALRAITPLGQCPSVAAANGHFAMHERAGPAEIPSRKKLSNPDERVAMPWRSCELSLNQAKGPFVVDGIRLAAPHKSIQRIVLIGDTGCRMKQSDDAFQNCNSAQDWPFAKIASAAAALKPDLVVHVGDLHYRESPCPTDQAGCSGSPWGYGQDVWLADVFSPAQTLLRAAPWLMVRGNHESCNRAGIGWHRFFDPYPWSELRSCNLPANDAVADFSPPFALPLDRNTQMIVFDSSFSGGKAYTVNDPAWQEYAREMTSVASLLLQKSHNWFLSHHPVLGFAVAQGGAPLPGSAALQSVLAQQTPQRLFPAGVDAAMSGHVHLFEGLDFASDHPLALVLGNAGSAMDRSLDLDRARSAQPAPGAQVRTLVTKPGFGFATLERTPDGWLLTERNADGQAALRCTLHANALKC